MFNLSLGGVLGLALAGIIGALLVWASIFSSPRSSCGLLNGTRYRVVKAFIAGENTFREGEVLIFKRERRYVPWPPDPTPACDTTPEQDLYDFVEVESKKTKSVSSLDFPSCEQWVRFLEEID
jgi:hypothetical protein